MAKIIYGAGVSHTPMLTLPTDDWGERAKADRANQELMTVDGRTMAYDVLLDERRGRFDDVIDARSMQERSDRCQAALDRVADDLEAARPDAVIIIGDDQEELFSPENTPVLSVYYGDEMVMHASPGAPLAEWRKTMRLGYAMDDFNRFPVSARLAIEIIEGLLDRDIDCASASHVADPARAGFGHAFGFIIRRLFKGRSIPVVPILLNTYYPPSVASPKRCFDIGRKLRAAIEHSSQDLRVAVIASGGLSHFVVEEEFDRAILADLERGGGAFLQSLPRHTFRSGTSEVLNWILAAGALDGAGVDWHEYIPLYRSPAGTGTGCAFLSWNRSN